MGTGDGTGTGDGMGTGDETGTGDGIGTRDGMGYSILLCSALLCSDIIVRSLLSLCLSKYKKIDYHGVFILSISLSVSLDSL